METCGLLLVLVLCREVFCQSHYCRSKFGVYEVADYNIHACAWCYFFLFPERDYKPNPLTHTLEIQTNGSRVYPDINNKSATGEICATLSSDECDKWRLCCLASRDCCTRQLMSSAVDDNTSCPTTWDGYGCWDAGEPGTTSYISCPNFLQYSVPTRSALKTCNADGKWLTKGPLSLEWTDYTPCLSYEELKVSIYISVGCQIASLLCLLPSVVIFLMYKSLNRQHRIRLHVNFFVSFISSGIFTILWNLAITHDRITNSNVVDTHIYKNSGECRVLSFLKIYFNSTNYVWMFSEGLYLYRLIANAFSPPKRLLLFYLFGWGFPFLYSSAYAIIRLVMADESCWAKSLGGGLEWIIFAPNLFCLVANVYFLCSILRILLTQLTVHPNEPSNFRKALKATFVLIPLFGVQLVLTIYRLPPESPHSLYYERFTEFITNSQGLVVAIIFCICNGEVVALIKHSWRRRQDALEMVAKRVNSASSLNHYNTVTSRINYQSGDKNSPSRTLISCMKKEESEEATDI